MRNGMRSVMKILGRVLMVAAHSAELVGSGASQCGFGFMA